MLRWTAFPFTVLILLYTVLSTLRIGFAAVAPEAVLMLFLMTRHAIAVLMFFTDRLPISSPMLQAAVAAPDRSRCGAGIR